MRTIFRQFHVEENVRRMFCWCLLCSFNLWYHLTEMILCWFVVVVVVVVVGVISLLVRVGMTSLTFDVLEWICISILICLMNMGVPIFGVYVYNCHGLFVDSCLDDVNWASASLLDHFGLKSYLSQDYYYWDENHEQSNLGRKGLIGSYY